MNYRYLEDFNEILSELVKEDNIKAAAPKLVYYGVKYINNSKK